MGLLGEQLMARAWHQNVKRARPEDRSIDGVVFDSKSEARRWAELQMLESVGEISDLKRQVRLPLVINRRVVKIRSSGFPGGRPCVYTVDFKYRDRAGTERWEEHKGHDDPAARLRRAVVEAIYGIEIIVTGPAAKATPGKRQDQIGRQTK